MSSCNSCSVFQASGSPERILKDVVYTLFFGFKRVEIMFSLGEDWERSVLREQEGINAFNIPAETRPKWGFDPSLP